MHSGPYRRAARHLEGQVNHRFLAGLQGNRGQGGRPGGGQALDQQLHLRQAVTAEFQAHFLTFARHDLQVRVIRAEAHATPGLAGHLQRLQVPQEGRRVGKRRTQAKAAGHDLRGGFRHVHQIGRQRLGGQGPPAHPLEEECAQAVQVGFQRGGRPGTLRAGQVRTVRVGRTQAVQPEITEQQPELVLLRGGQGLQQNVLGFQVAVQGAVRVREIQALRDLPGHVQHGVHVHGRPGGPVAFKDAAQ